MATRNAEWHEAMDALRPPVYVCLQRTRASDGSFPHLELHGCLDRTEWQHVPWSHPFLDIEGDERKPRVYPRTRVKMMHDDEWFYVGAELVEPKIWGTILEKNATLYHENDFEVFLNPDGSRHNYYELELNCLNTIWELVLNKPYKDGYSIQNPYNLASTRTAVYIDGVANAPRTECTKWCVEIAFSLHDLVQFDRLRNRIAQPGDVWRVNFSRVQYHLQTVLDDETQQLKYEKLPDTREDNIVWAPTGVVDIHRPEKWGFVLFAQAVDEHDGIRELNTAMESFLCEQIAMERVLDTVYYDQKTYFATHDCYAASLEVLYGSLDAFPCREIVVQFQLTIPTIQDRCNGENTQSSQNASPDAARRHPNNPRLTSDEGDETLVITPQSVPLLEYTVSIQSTAQQWNMDNEARLWQSALPTGCEQK